MTFIRSDSQLNAPFRLLRRTVLLIAVAFVIAVSSLPVAAHQQPTTIVLLDINPDRVTAELEIPLSELELAFGHDVTKDTDTLISRVGADLYAYLLAHIHPVGADGRPWAVEIVDQKVERAVQTQSGPYQEITVRLLMRPPAGSDTRKFTLNYDVIMHQVVTHKALVSIRHDWERGMSGDSPVEAGVIQVDTGTTKIYPLEVNLDRGSWLSGFRGMISLGMQHIREGTDHLLFLLTLLLPATLLFSAGRWDGFGGARYSVVRLLKIVTAFTLGHSLTLLIGALGWLRLPQQPVEVLIAISILVSAVHAIRPIFPGREMYIAGGFGLIHGLAFATVLTSLNLGAGPMALSILGFNLGIELMQLFVIAMVAPWLIILSPKPVYRWVRIVGASLAGFAALVWIAERVSNRPNILGRSIQEFSNYAFVIILLLALIALASYVFDLLKVRRSRRLLINVSE